MRGITMELIVEEEVIEEETTNLIEDMVTQNLGIEVIKDHIEDMLIVTRPREAPCHYPQLTTFMKRFEGESERT